MAETLQLAGSGQRMPTKGLGTWKLPKEKAAETVHAAIKAGYRLIDCACDYGNEKEVGLGIKQAIDEGIVKREQLFVTSKLWNTFHAKEHVRPAFERSRTDLGLAYLDLYLIHFPVSIRYVPPERRYPPGWLNDPSDKNLTYADVPIQETWRAMEELHNAGLVKNIGVSNFNVSILMDLLKYAKVNPAVNQVEIHPFLPQDRLVDFCHRHKVQITAYSSFGASSWIPLGLDRKIEPLLENKAVNALAKQLNKSPAQILLRWAIQRGLAVIPKSESISRLKSNFELEGFELSADDMNQIAALNKSIRFNDPGYYFDAPIFD